MKKIEFKILLHDKDEKAFIDFLKKMDKEFAIPLSARIEIEPYVKKLFSRGVIIGAWDQENLCGICGGYTNDVTTKRSVVTCLVVSRIYRNKAIGKHLFMEFVKVARDKGMKEVYVSTNKKNKDAIVLYERVKMKKISETPDEIFYHLLISDFEIK